MRWPGSKRTKAKNNFWPPDLSPKPYIQYLNSIVTELKQLEQRVLSPSHPPPPHTHTQVKSASARPQQPSSFRVCSLPRSLRRHADSKFAQQAPERASCFPSISAESTLLGSVTECFTVKYLQTDAEFANILNMHLFCHIVFKQTAPNALNIHH